MVPTTLASRKISSGCRWTSTAPLVYFSVAVAMVVPSLVDRDETSCSLPTASCLVAGHEALAVEHLGHDPPCQPVDEEEGGSETEGEAERRGDHVLRHEGHHGERGKAGEHPDLLGDADVASSRRDGNAHPDRPSGEQRGEQQLGEDVGSFEHRGRDGG